MGLDVTAVSKAELTPLTFEQYDEDPDFWKTHTYAYPEPHFTAQADGLAEGVYQVASKIDGPSWSYSGYNRWRDHLSRLMLHVPAEMAWRNPHTYGDSPFYALIHFSGCEGIIGPQTSARLAADFATYAERAAQEDADWLAGYTALQQMFEIASDGGFVKFH